MTLGAKKVHVEPYNFQWGLRYQSLRAVLWPLVESIAESIEHVGSTSVPGLWAKPVIDIDIVILSEEILPRVIEKLTIAGYAYLGNLGIEGRYAFKAHSSSIIHNLYVCLSGCVALRNHLTLRDHLISSVVDRAAYSSLKRSLAERFPDDMDSYVEGKTSFILRILKNYGVDKDELDLIEKANRA